ncbi:hypothetical protein LCGC14_0815440 [marine sediment metagenome]|uniref:Uncharacterized protein n=1 Tax=marine sediment metagenome TaxID=412755 RepID=A0A0F9PQ12_9ZZZZ
MRQVLFGILILYIFIYYPEVILLAGLILAGFYFHNKYELTERNKTVADEVDDGPTIQERMEKEVEANMKQGFRDDPEWKKLSKKVNDRAIIMREISDLEMQIEDLEKELAETCDSFTANVLERAKERLKTLENRAGITQKRAERAKEEKPDSQSVGIPQTPPRDMTDQEIDRALQELND